MDLQASALQGEGYHIRADKEPDTCPRCHRSIHPKLIVASIIVKQGITQAIFKCTHHSCEEVFIANYATPSPRNGAINPGSFLSTAPKSALPSNFPEAIVECSPTFVQIYDQAIAAESNDLDQIVGIGMRKALEFLIKDYVCLENPDKTEAIKKTLLGKCIDEYILDSNVKACAKRATWLGNDETHYVRKWTDQDINDLKRLIKLTVNWIDNALTTKKYLSAMPDPAVIT
jgi:hypothetical protein